MPGARVLDSAAGDRVFGAVFRQGWKRVASGLAVAALLAAGMAEGAVFGLIDTGELYTSTDDGSTWTILAALPAHDAVGLAAGTSASELFIVTRSGSVHRSLDGGVSWTAVGALTASDVVSFTIRHDGSMLVLTGSGTLYRSTDGGATFSPVAAFTASNFVSLTPGPLGRLYALTRTGGVYESQDGGTWTPVGSVPASNAVSIRRKDAVLYLLTETGEVYRSLDYGRSWLSVGRITASNMKGVVANGPTLLSAAATGEVYASSDGTAWFAVGAINQSTVMSLGTDTPLVTGIPVEETSPSFTAHAPFPNPTTRLAGSRFTFTTPAPDWVRLELYDARGRRVGSRAGFFGSAGKHEISWAPRGLASGTYVVRFTTGSGRTSQVKWSLLQ